MQLGHLLPFKLTIYCISSVIRQSFFFSSKTIPEFCLIRQGLVVQSIVSLTSSLRGQLVKCFTTL